MIVKRYIVADMSEAMTKIRRELGPDAVILSEQKIKNKGFFGIFKKPLLEVVAAVDDFKEKKYDRSEKSDKDARQDSNQMPSKEYTELKAMLEQLMAKMESDAPKTVATENTLPVVLEHSSKDNSLNNNDDSKEPYVKYLVSREVAPNIAKKIVDIVGRQISLSLDNKESVISAMKVITKEYLGDPRPIREDSGHILFLGPTGVGKTTTIAKIAARLRLEQNKSIAFITADTYRIAAIEQLKTYGEILNIPVSVVYSSSDMQKAIELYKDYDYVLIDTAGRSHKSNELISDYNEIADVITPTEIFLVLSLTTSIKDLRSIVNSYNFLEDYALLFTKLDEASSLTNILNLKIISGKPLSYFAVGQNVPDDIEIANKEKILDYIFSEEEEDGSGTKA